MYSRKDKNKKQKILKKCAFPLNPSGLILIDRNECEIDFKSRNS